MVKPVINQKFVMELQQVEVDQSSILDTQISHNGVNNFFQPQVQALQPMPLMRHQMLIYLENFSGLLDFILMKMALYGLAVVMLGLKTVAMMAGKTKPKPLILAMSAINIPNRTVSWLV